MAPRAHGFLERRGRPRPSRRCSPSKATSRRFPSSSTVATHQKVGEAIDPTSATGSRRSRSSGNGDEAGSLADVVGPIRESGLLDRVFRNQDVLSEDIATAMELLLPAVEIGASVAMVFADLCGEPGGRRRLCGRLVGVLTRADRQQTLLISRAQGDGAVLQPRHARGPAAAGTRVLRGARLDAPVTAGPTTSSSSRRAEQPPPLGPRPAGRGQRRRGHGGPGRRESAYNARSRRTSTRSSKRRGRRAPASPSRATTFGVRLGGFV